MSPAFGGFLGEVFVAKQSVKPLASDFAEPHPRALVKDPARAFPGCRRILRDPFLVKGPGPKVPIFLGA